MHPVADNLDFFPFKWPRFLLGTMNFSAEEVGAYLLLLIYEWDKGFIPAEEKEIRKICRIPRKSLTKVLQKFEEIDKKFYNATLEEIRIEVTEKLEKNSKSASKAAKARWKKHADALRMQCVDDANKEKKSKPKESKENENENPTSAEFEKVETENKGLGAGQEIQKPNPIPPAAVVADLLRRHFDQSESWIESLCMKHKVGRAAIPGYFDEFFLHLKTQGKGGISKSEAVSYFDNWLGRQPKKNAVTVSPNPKMKKLT